VPRFKRNITITQDIKTQIASVKYDCKSEELETFCDKQFQTDFLKIQQEAHLSQWDALAWAYYAFALKIKSEMLLGNVYMICT